MEGENVDFTDDEIEQSLEQFKAIIKDAREDAYKSKSFRTPQEYSQVFRKKLVSKLTNRLVKNVILGEVSEKEAMVHGTERNKELKLGDLRPLCTLLKDAIFECATRDEYISLYEKRGEIVVKSLFEAFTDSQVNKKNKLIPPDFRYEKEPNNNIRGVIDFIAGMMDTFAIEKYEQLFGVNFNEIPVSNNTSKKLSLLEWEVEKLNHTTKWLNRR